MKCEHCFVKDSPYGCPAKGMPHPVLCKYADPEDKMHKPQFKKTVENLCEQYKFDISVDGTEFAPPKIEPVYETNITLYDQQLINESLDIEAPTLVEKAFSFLKSLKKHISGVNSLREVVRDVSDDVYEQRKSICQRCVFRRESSCGVCGCVISIKAAWASESCPKGFWQSGNVPPNFQNKGCGCGK